jgi:hypothetical protein
MGPETDWLRRLKQRFANPWTRKPYVPRTCSKAFSLCRSSTTQDNGTPGRVYFLE